MVVNGAKSSWIPVWSGVPQGSVLGPVLFVIFINDLDEAVRQEISVLLKFADDTKIGNEIAGPEDREVLQEALDSLWAWSRKWGMDFNIAKCHILHIGNSNPGYSYSLDGKVLESVNSERDIGVIITDTLKPHVNCEKAANTARAVLGQILRTFSYRDRTVLMKLYKQYVRPHLEFSIQAWSPWQRRDVHLLESIQEKAVRQVAGLKSSQYEERLHELAMTTLEERRREQDLVQMFKIIRQIDNVDPTIWFTMVPDMGTRRTEGGLNVRRNQAHLEVRRNFYSSRVAETWNTLPLSVKSANTVSGFKRMLREQ